MATARQSFHAASLRTCTHHCTASRQHANVLQLGTPKRIRNSKSSTQLRSLPLNAEELSSTQRMHTSQANAFACIELTIEG